MGEGNPTTVPPGAGVDVFVSYTGADEEWATWVAAVLEAEGQRVAIRAWDSPAGTNFVAWINEQMSQAVRTVAICSRAYFGSYWCAQEWAGALAGNTLILLRVEACTIPPVLATISYRGLHGIDEATARRRLVEAVGLARPERRSSGFPGRPALSAMAVFPGQRAPEDARAVAPLTVPRGAVRVADADPYRLGVHPAIRLAEVAEETPPVYVERDIDQAPDGVRARLRSAATRGGFVLLVGGSSVGKTRCAIEAVKAELSDWWLLRPSSVTDLRVLAAAPPARIVLWLDELQTYFGGEHGLTAGVVHALVDAPGPVVLVGTLWPTYYRTFAALPTPGAPGTYEQERAILHLAAVVDVDEQLTPAEQARARHSAELDRRLQVALDSPDHGLTQTLAAGPELIRHWTSARTDNIYAWAILTATLDAARLGARNPLPGDLLRAAAADYCPPRQQAQAPADWFEHALAYATIPLHGSAAALTPTSNGTGMGRTAGYVAADYLRQHANTVRRYIRPPASLWTALRDRLTHPDDLERFTYSAFDYRIYALAVPLLRQRAEGGDRFAANRLTEVLTAAAGRDTTVQQTDLPEPKDSASPIERPHRRADTDDSSPVLKPRDLPTEAEALRRLAGTGDRTAACQLAALLLEAGDRAGAIEYLRPLADAGMGDDWDLHDHDAAGRLSNLMAQAGDREELRRRADAGDWWAAQRLATLLLEEGDRTGALEVLRLHPNSPECAHRLDELLADAGDREELRRRAEAGNRHAAFQLFGLLAREDDREELRRHADAGDWAAISHLAGLLALGGDDRLRRYGFDLHGQIADGPTW